MRAAALLALVIGGLLFCVAAFRAAPVAVAGLVTQALWIVPALVALHLFQLFLAAGAWRTLFAAPAPGRLAFYRLRIIREAIDSLLPVAQVGGELVGARLLAAAGVPATGAAASVVVDVTIELLTQLAFLLAGIAGLLALAPVHGLPPLTRTLPALAALAAALLAAQRFGLLRAVEHLSRGVARRWPALTIGPLDGLHLQAAALYRQPAAMLRTTLLHLLAWALGSLEAWAVLHALGVNATFPQAFTIESLGMAARSAGFAIPAALGAQEGGFVLAAAALGISAAPAFALSLVKRIREILVGLIGITLWRVAALRAVPP